MTNATSKRRRRTSPNRGIVLALHDAYAIHRWLELLMDDRRFFNPLEAMDAEKAAIEAKARLEGKLIAHAEGHQRIAEATDDEAFSSCRTE